MCIANIAYTPFRIGEKQAVIKRSSPQTIALLYQSSRTTIHLLLEAPTPVIIFLFVSLLEHATSDPADASTASSIRSSRPASSSSSFADSSSPAPSSLHEKAFIVPSRRTALIVLFWLVGFSRLGDVGDVGLGGVGGGLCWAYGCC